MKKTALVLSLISVLGLSACGTFDKKSQGLKAPTETSTAVKDTRISTDFTDQGIKIFYTMGGKLEKIEVFGTAPAWKGNVEIVAEADAMDKLVKFVHGQTVSTDRRVKIMTKAMDRARDNTLNRFKTVDGTVAFNAQELESDAPSAPRASEESGRDNTSRRIADRVEDTLINTVTTITAQGRLTGVRKVRDEVKQDGRLYVAIFQWSPEDQSVSELLRSRMR